MTPDENKAIVRKINGDAWHSRSLADAYQAYGDGIIFHRPPFPAVVGKEANMVQDEGMLAAFTDTRIELLELAAEGDTVVAHWLWDADHTGTSPSLGIPATGKAVQLAGCSIYHFKDGKVVEQWEYNDLLGLLQQVGVIPAMA